MPALTLHRGPYMVRGFGMAAPVSRTTARVEWDQAGELVFEIENDFGTRRMKLSPRQVDRLVSFLLQPYVVSQAEEVSPVGKSGKGKGSGKGGGRGGRC